MSQTVLIVEDEQKIAHWVRAYFEEAGFRVLVAPDGPTGLHVARTERPDLLILDLMPAIPVMALSLITATFINDFLSP